MAKKITKLLLKIIIALGCLFFWSCIAVSGVFRAYEGEFNFLVWGSYALVLVLIFFWDKRPARFFRLIPSALVALSLIALILYFNLVKPSVMVPKPEPGTQIIEDIPGYAARDYMNMEL